MSQKTAGKGGGQNLRQPFKPEVGAGTSENHSILQVQSCWGGAVWKYWHEWHAMQYFIKGNWPNTVNKHKKLALYCSNFGNKSSGRPFLHHSADQMFGFSINICQRSREENWQLSRDCNQSVAVTVWLFRNLRSPRLLETLSVRKDSFIHTDWCGWGESTGVWIA